MAGEQILQTKIRNHVATARSRAKLFRVNVGTGWTGKVSNCPDGSKLIREPRPLSSGLPKGFADLIGWVPVVIGPEHVGQTLAVVVALEVKTDTGRPTPEQLAFIAAVVRDGGRAAIVRSPEAAIQVIDGGQTDGT